MLPCYTSEAQRFYGDCGSNHSGRRSGKHTNWSRRVIRKRAYVTLVPWIDPDVVMDGCMVSGMFAKPSAHQSMAVHNRILRCTRYT